MKKFIFLISIAFLSCSNSSPNTEERFVKSLIRELKTDDPTSFIKKLVITEQELDEIYTDSTNIIIHRSNGVIINEAQKKKEKLLKSKHKIYALVTKRIPNWDDAKIVSQEFKYGNLTTRPSSKNIPQNKVSSFSLNFDILRNDNKEIELEFRGYRLKDGTYKLYDLEKAYIH